MSGYDFHPEALLEYAGATDFYLHEANSRVATAFVGAVEHAIGEILDSPARWRVVERPNIRRRVLKRFPYVIYYSWSPERKRVTIFAVMHCSREPGYWKSRVL